MHDALSFSSRFHLLTRLTVAHLRDIDELSSATDARLSKSFASAVKYSGYSIRAGTGLGEQNENLAANANHRAR